MSQRKKQQDEKNKLIDKLDKLTSSLIKSKVINKPARGNLASNIFNDLDRSNVPLDRLKIIETILDDIKNRRLDKNIKTKEYKSVISKRSDALKNINQYVYNINTDTPDIDAFELVRDILLYSLQKETVKLGSFVVEWRNKSGLMKSKTYQNVKSISSWWNKKPYKATDDWAGSLSNVVYEYKILNSIPDDEFDEMENIIIIYNLGTVEARMIKQVYRGDGLCWANQIDKYFMDRIKNNEGKKADTIERYKREYKKLEELKNKYKEGLPEDKWDEVCDTLKISCVLYDPFGKEMKQYGNNDRKVCRKTFKFVNSCFGHLDDVYFGVNDIYDVNKNELMALYEKYKMYKENEDGIYCVRSLCSTYRLIDEDKEAGRQYKEEIAPYYINADSAEYKFISKSITCNKSVWTGLPYTEEEIDILGEYKKKRKVYNIDGVKAMDISRAYGRWYNCKYYMGLPTKMGNFRKIGQWINKEWLQNRIGFFKCNFNNTGRWAKYGLVNGVVLGTPEIMFYLDCGVEVFVDIGLYGCSSMDALIFDEDFIDRKLYVKFIGCLDKIGGVESWNLKGEMEFAMILKSLGYNAYYNNGIIRITKEIESNKWYGHYASYIQMYSRINVFNRIKDMAEEDVLGIKTDCILYKGEYKLLDGWREDRICGLDCLKEYGMWDILEEDVECGSYVENCDINGLFVGGFGGGGKTYDKMTDKGYIGAVYTAVCWDKVVDAIKNYNCKGYSLAMMLGEGCRSCVEEGIYPSVIVVDEMTMINNERVEKLKKLYWFSQIIYIGDVNKDGVPFQCCGLDWKLDMNKFKWVAGSVNDYRAKDDKLKMIKEELRRMNEEFIKGGFISCNKFVDKRCYELIEKQIKYIKEMLVKGDLNDYDFMDDFIIVSTKKQIERYNVAFSDMPKYKMVKHKRSDVWKKMRGEDVLINGNYAHMDGEGMEMRHASTVHSVQGMTIEGRIYIDLDHIFDINQIYTAVSRGRYSDKVCWV